MKQSGYFILGSQLGETKREQNDLEVLHSYITRLQSRIFAFQPSAYSATCFKTELSLITKNE